MSIQRASVLYPVNTKLIHSGTGIDLKWLSDSQPGADADTQTCSFTHANDDQFRTWDPATSGVTTNANPTSVLRTLGYDLQLLEAMSPTSYLSPDASSAGNDCLIIGAPTVVAGETGFGNRLNFPTPVALLDQGQGGRSESSIALVSLSAFTLEGRVRRDRTANVESALIFMEMVAGTAVGGFQIVFLTASACELQYWNAGLQATIASLSTVGVGEHKFAIEWTGSTLYFYINGVVQGSSALASLPSINPHVWLARGPSTDAGSNTFPTDCAVDEVRLSNVARYGGANYTPATTPFTDDANTLLLWHLDEIETPCKTVLTAGSITVNLQVRLNQTGGTYVSGSYGPDFRASLWRYNHQTGVATLIGNGQNFAAVTWDYTPGTGDLNTFKAVAITISVPTPVEFELGETLHLQLGFATATVPNPTVGTATWVATLRVDNTGTNITFASGQGIRLICREALTGVARGVASISRKKQTTLAAAMRGVASLAREITAARTLGVVMFGIATRDRVVTASRLFSSVMLGVSSRIVLTVNKSMRAAMLGVTPRIMLMVQKPLTTVMLGVISTVRKKNTTLTARMTGVATLTKLATLRRTLTATMLGIARGRIEMAFEVLSRITGAASAFIRKIIIYDKV